MNDKELKAYQEKLMSGAKGTIGLGVVTGLGSYAFGRVGAAHPEVAPTSNAVTGALNLANIGNMAAIGMSILPGQENPEKVLDKKLKTKKPSAINDPLSFF
jgi:hypothetical protein